VQNPQGITFAAVGDIMMGTDYPENILPDDDGLSFLASVTPVLSAADIAFGNLEGVLMDGGEAVKRCKPPPKAKAAADKAPAKAAAPTSQPAVPSAPGASPAAPRFDVERSDTAIAPVPIEEASTDPARAANGTPEVTKPPQPDAPAGDEPANQAAVPNTASTSAPPAATTDPSSNPAPTGGSCYVFRSPTRYAAYLRDAGFDVMSLANNHAQDFGDPGRDSSMQALDAVGIRHSGREGDVAEWITNGRRLAMVAFAPNVGSHQLNDLVRASEVVSNLAGKNDIVVVSFHGGAEGDGAQKLPFAREMYAGEDRGDVVEFARAVIDAGADLVIGHGPHVMRPLELYRDRLIAYSLGNFATYYGISVNGIRGTSGVLVTRLADDGRFIDARFTSTVQIRPGGPQLDPEHRALAQLRELTREAFPEGALIIKDDGLIERIPTATAGPQ
jgi:poly-gamma-glutamate capsule biosynthesis protein CapA/YwtB (metallophosphatase superfamily)